MQKYKVDFPLLER